jgi:hypothetical protein
MNCEDRHHHEDLVPESFSWQKKMLGTDYCVCSLPFDPIHCCAYVKTTLDVHELRGSSPSRRSCPGVLFLEKEDVQYVEKALQDDR